MIEDRNSGRVLIVPLTVEPDDRHRTTGGAGRAGRTGRDVCMGRNLVRSARLARVSEGPRRAAARVHAAAW
jgi:hypothetical protein